MSDVVDIKNAPLREGDRGVLVHRMSGEWLGQKNSNPLQVVLVLIGYIVNEDTCEIHYVRCIDGPVPGDKGTFTLSERCVTNAILRIPQEIVEDKDILAFIRLAGYYTDEG